MAHDEVVDKLDFSTYSNKDFQSLWVSQIENGISDSIKYGMGNRAVNREAGTNNPYARYINRSLAIIQHITADYDEDLRYFIAWRLHWKDSASVDMARYICALQRMYKTGNLEYIRYYVTEERYNLYKKEFEVLNSYGLRKEIDFQFFDDGQEDAPTIKEDDGKNQVFSPAQYGTYKEIYLNQAGEVLYEYKVDNACVRLYMYKSKFKDLIEESKADTCFNCGAEIRHEFETYRCPYCNVEYDGESLTWIATDLWIEEIPKEVVMEITENSEPKQNFLTKIKNSFVNSVTNVVMPILIILAIAMAFLDFKQLFAKFDMKAPDILLPPQKYIPISILLAPIAILIIISILGLVFTLIFSPKIHKNYKAYKINNNTNSLDNSSRDLELEIQTVDKNFSINSLRRHLNAMNINELISQEFLKQGENLLNYSAPLITLGKQYYKDYPQGRAAEVLELIYKLPSIIVREEQNRLEFRTVNIDKNIILIRDKGIKTPLYTKATQFTCPNCGGHSRLNKEEWQICIYCGNKVELRTIDWQVLTTNL